MIDITKKYRFRNVPFAEILAIVHRDGKLGVMYVRKGNIYAAWHNEDGSIIGYGDKNYNLVEISPYDGWKVNKEIYVTNCSLPNGEPSWWWGATKRHFSHVGYDGTLYTFGEGRSKFTHDGTVEPWRFAKPSED